MSSYTVDPRFKVFNALFPYKGDGKQFYDLRDFPMSAAASRPHEDPATSNPGETASSSGNDETGSRIIDDETRTLLMKSAQYIANIVHDPFHDLKCYGCPDTEECSDLQELGALLDDCIKHVPIDIDRLTRSALQLGRLDIVRYLVEHRGASLTSRDTVGKSPVHYAASSGKPKVLEFLARGLIDQGSLQREINHQDLSGKTSLHYAVARPEERLTELCLEYGADPDLQDKSGTSVLMLGQEAYDYNMLLVALYRRLQLSLEMPLYLSGRWIAPKALTVQQLGDSAKLDERDKPDPLIWLHVPWTNGALIMGALIRALNWPDLHRSIPSWIARSIIDSFESPPTVPGDKLLSYRPSSCRQCKPRFMGPGICSIVFPCLVMQDMQSFRESRSHSRELRQLIEWPKVAHYLHVARTLDEAYYPSLAEATLQARNEAQVVTREYGKLLDGSDASKRSKPILMVSQYWVWRCSDFVLSAYSPPGKIPSKPAEYRQPERIDETELWMQEDLHAPVRLNHDWKPCAEYQASCLIADQVADFGRPQAGGKYQSPLDYFESGVVHLLTDVDGYTQDNNLKTSVNVGLEAKFISEIADIREELAMIDDVLRQQDEVLDRLIPLSECDHEPRQETTRLKERERPPMQLSSNQSPVDILLTAKGQIQGYRDRVARIDRDAERIDKAIGDLLNLKRTDASMRDAAESGKDARASLLLGTAVIGFTGITIIFAPLAFMTALFALDIDGLAKHKSGKGNDAVYPGWYIFATFGASVVATVLFTILIVWLCLRYQHRLTSLADWISRKPEDDGRTPDLDKNETTSTTTSKTTATAAARAATMSPSTGPGQTTAVEKENTRSDRHSVLSQPRQRPRTADPTDAEERGELTILR